MNTQNVKVILAISLIFNVVAIPNLFVAESTNKNLQSEIVKMKTELQRGSDRIQAMREEYVLIHAKNEVNLVRAKSELNQVVNQCADEKQHLREKLEGIKGLVND